MENVEIPLSSGGKLICIEVPADATNFTVLNNTGGITGSYVAFNTSKEPEDIDDLKNYRRWIGKFMKAKDSIIGMFSPRTEELHFYSPIELTKWWNKNKLGGRKNKIAAEFVEVEAWFKKLLKAETTKKYPFMENQFGELLHHKRYAAIHKNLPPSTVLSFEDYKKRWEQAQTTVMPAKFVLIRTES